MNWKAILATTAGSVLAMTLFEVFVKPRLARRQTVTEQPSGEDAPWWDLWSEN